MFSGAKSRFRLAFVAIAACGGLAGGIARGEATYDLSPNRQAGETARVDVLVDVGGEMLLNDEKAKEPRKVPMNVSAHLVYDEAVVEVDAATGAPQRALRYYDAADATIKIGDGAQRPKLSDGHKLIAAFRSSDHDTIKTTLIGANGALSREELELIDLPGGSLLVDDLLPRKAVTVGESWRHPEGVLSSLVGIDVTSIGEVQSSLVSVQKDVAKMVLSGTITGAVGGVSTEIEVKGKYTFNLKERRIAWFALLIKEKRSIGHIGPGLDVTAKLIMSLTPIESSGHLDDAALASAPPAEEPSQSQLVADLAGGAVKLSHDRRWHVTSDEATLAVLRLVDRGELVAQCNVAPLAVMPLEKQGTLEEFQAEVQRSLGETASQIEKVSQSGKSGLRVLRVVALGEVSDVPMQWIYYLVSDQEGHRASIVFTVEQSLLKRFDTSDQAIVDALKFSEKTTTTAARPKKSAR